MAPIRIGLMSDTHVSEFDDSYQHRLRFPQSRHSDVWTSANERAFATLKELDSEEGHPRRGPDLRALKAAEVDFVLLAGDISVGLDAIQYADEIARYIARPVVSIGGNHEAYGKHLPYFVNGLVAAAETTAGRVRYLERARADLIVGDRKIAVLGATLWTDYCLNGDPNVAMASARDLLRDHRKIRYSSGRFLPIHARTIHLETRAWLENANRKAREESDAIIVLTHHAPVPDAVDPQEPRITAPAYCSDLREQIEEWEPALWAWGHTHHPYLGQAGRMILRSAPRGYIGYQAMAENFQPAVIEIP